MLYTNTYLLVVLPCYDMSELRSASDAPQSTGRQRLTGLEWQRKISALKIGVVFIGAILVSLQLWMIFHHQEGPSGAATDNGANVTSAYERELWRKELTDGARHSTGPTGNRAQMISGQLTQWPAKRQLHTGRLNAATSKLG